MSKEWHGHEAMFPFTFCCVHQDEKNALPSKPFIEKKHPGSSAPIIQE